MPLPFINVVGTPATPLFAEMVLQEYVVDANGNSSNFVNVFHYQNQNPGTVCTELALMTVLRTAMSGPLASALSIASLGKNQKLRFMDNPLSGYIAGTIFAAGTVTGDRLPTFNAAVTQCRTGVRGRSFKGSKHWGPVAESHTTLDELNAAALIFWTAVSGIITNGGAGFAVTGGSLWKLIVLSTTLSDLVSNPCVFTGAVVTTTTTNKEIGTMRRRKERGGIST